MTFTAETVISILPRATLYLNGIVGGTLESRILLSRQDGKPLEISGIRCEDPGLKLQAVAVDPDSDQLPKTRNGEKPTEGGIWLQASLEGDVVPGNRSGTVWITTNHPKMKEMQIPYSVRVRPVLEVRPSMVRLWLSDADDTPRTTMFRVVHNGGKPFSIAELKVADEDLIQVANMDDGKPSAYHNIKVDLHPSKTVEDFSIPRQTKLFVKTTDPTNPELEVPVSIQVRATAHRRPPTATRKSDSETSRPSPRPLPTGTPMVRPRPTGTPIPAR